MDGVAFTVGDLGVVLVTGACGHIGHEVCRALRAAGLKVLPTDTADRRGNDVVACDLRSKSDVSGLFQRCPIGTIIHLAGILPGRFQADPVLGIEVNVSACVELMRQAAAACVKRFLFGSSMSVYGTSFTRQPVTEEDPTTPDDAYGASKRVVEVIGEMFDKKKSLQFISLRIARLSGPGIRQTSSPWRAEIFEAHPNQDAISVPFAPGAKLSLVHVAEVSRMLVTLVLAAKTKYVFYNTPVEIWEAHRLKEFVEELRGVRVELGPKAAHGGPQCNGSRFSREFGFQLRGLREYFGPQSFLIAEQLT